MIRLKIVFAMRGLAPPDRNPGERIRRGGDSQMRQDGEIEGWRDREI